ncbi:MAG: helix-turn-helix domain-containing protein [Ruminococcus sp.]|nr:helix-turn-helix domain-containing protein [Ruminococcus sp.]
MPNRSRSRPRGYITSLDEVPLFVDVAYICNLLQLQPDTIRKRLQEGSLKGVKVGAVWRIPKTEIERLYNEGGEIA